MLLNSSSEKINNGVQKKRYGYFQYDLLDYSFKKFSLNVPFEKVLSEAKPHCLSDFVKEHFGKVILVDEQDELIELLEKYPHLNNNSYIYRLGGTSLYLLERYLNGHSYFNVADSEDASFWLSIAEYGEYDFDQEQSFQRDLNECIKSNLTGNRNLLSWGERSNLTLTMHFIHSENFLNFISVYCKKLETLGEGNK